MVSTAPQKRRPTQIDVARAAGVSQATVSSVLRDPSKPVNRIPEATRDRVIAAAKELGYSPNAAAQRLVGGRSFLLGFHTFEDIFPADQQDFYFDFLLGVESEASRRGYDLMLLSPTAAAQSARGDFGSNAAARRLLVADGGILVGRHVDNELLAELSLNGYAYVLIGRRENASIDVPYVALDYAKATAALVAELTAIGHRRLGYIGEPGGGEQTEDRLAGYWRGLDEAGIRDGSLKHGAPLTPEELRRWTETHGITAVLVEPGNDDANVERLASVAAELGLRIPEDLSVVVLGDPPFTSAPRDWTRFALPRHLMGVTAVELLIGMLDEEDGPRQKVVDAELVAGTTIAPPHTGSAAR
ncbi:MAG: LacI family DNA-binding transcriptional regulator [Protaetiibacter sp.]